MKTLTDKDLIAFQDAIYKDHGIKLEGKALYEAAFDLLQFFEALIKFRKQNTKQPEKPKKVLKSSKRTH
ncbi:hypothetical protein HY469_03420 [Candidatus Roizmanbacteria bacterium]|nr:hypothetical protein [Candidatus Roizmanbacteria bacterium]